MVQRLWTVHESVGYKGIRAAFTQEQINYCLEFHKYFKTNKPKYDCVDMLRIVLGW
jgi:hypothetical protein